MKKFKIIVCIILTMIMTLNFAWGILVPDEKERRDFKEFQQDSENLVIGRIMQDYYNLNDNKYGLQFIKKGNTEEEKDIETNDYKSSVGLQGRIFSFLYNKLKIKTFMLNCICSALLAIVLVYICYLLYEKYGKLFSAIFFIVFLCSPWIVNFARNLYWVPFAWFLPLMFCLLLSKTKNMKIFLPLIFMSVLFKSLCGYEYLSTILLTSITFLVADSLLKKKERKEYLKMILGIGTVSILAFIVAICIHGYYRGEGNVLNGIRAIYKEDVLRRTISSDSDPFSNEMIKESIHASFGSVVKKYFRFNTDILYGLEGKLFPTISIFSLLIVLYDIYRNTNNGKRDLILYLMFFAGTMSWFVLGKAHSYIHTHMNYVLWYFGYVQMCIYIIVKFIINAINSYKKEENKI